MDWSYVACYLDCEGTVGLWDNGNRPNSKVVSLTWYNSDLQSLQDMQAFMGRGYLRPSSRSALGTKPMYELALTKKAHILYALDHMLPYLRIKKDAALRLQHYLLDNVDEERAKNFGLLKAIPEADYRRWYEDEGKSLADIAAMLDATPAGILRVLRVYGIARRGNGGLNKGKPKSEATRANMKASRAALWQDPEFRAQQLANLAKGPRGRRPKGYTKPAIQGEKHPRSKLSDPQTLEIREKYATGSYSLNGLATEYGVSKKTILNIVHDKIRTNVRLSGALRAPIEEPSLFDTLTPVEVPAL